VKYLSAEDKLDIARVLSAYGFALDFRDFAALRTIFADDATIDYYNGSDERQGIEAIIEFLSKTVTSVDMTQHIMGSFLIDEESIDIARVHCNVTAHHLVGLAQGGAPPEETYTLSGRYSDRFERGTDGWRIRHRAFVGLARIGAPQLITRY
jgi:hypothetical protein